MKTIEKLFTLGNGLSKEAQITLNRWYRKAFASLLTGFLVYFGLLQIGCTFGLRWLMVGTMVAAAIIVNIIYWQPGIAGLGAVIELLNKNDDPNKQTVLRVYLMLMICIAGTGSIALILGLIGSSDAFIPVVLLLSAGTIACLLYSGTTDISKVMQWLALAAAGLVVVMIIVSNPFVLGWLTKMHATNPSGFWITVAILVLHVPAFWALKWLITRKDENGEKKTSSSGFGKFVVLALVIGGIYYVWKLPEVQRAAAWVEQNTPDPKAPKAGLPTSMDLIVPGEARNWFVSFWPIWEPLPSKNGMRTPKGGLALWDESFVVDGGTAESVNIGISLEGTMEPDMYLKSGPSGACRVTNAGHARLTCTGDWSLGNGQVYGTFTMYVKANSANVTLYKFAPHSNAHQEVARFAIIRRNSDKAND